MRLFIRLENGNPVDHPIVEDNFRQAFPEIDVDNLPATFANFERVQPPIPGVYDNAPVCKYEFVGNIVKDVWTVTPMTYAEVTAKREATQANWAANENTPKSWVFNETTCMFEPPMPRPADEEGFYWQWDEPALAWVKHAIPVAQ